MGKEKATRLNEVTNMPSSDLSMLFDKEIQMEEENTFMRFTSVAVRETFLAGFLYRKCFGVFFCKILMLPKEGNFSESWFERKETKEEHGTYQNLQQIRLNVPL